MRKIAASSGSISLLSLAVALGLALAPVHKAEAKGKTFALIEKGLMDPYGAKMKTGCDKAAAEQGDTCVYIGPSQADDSAQVQIFKDELTKGVDGIALAARNPKSMARFIAGVHDLKIPLITTDSDLLPQDAKLRTTFVGTDNYQFGATLARQVMAMKPKGGTVCIQSGTPGALNLDTRVQGVRDTLAGVDRDHPASRLTGQNGWTEPAGCPLYNMDDINTAAQQLNDTITAHPDLDALIAVGGWAQYAPTAYRKAVGRVIDRIRSKAFVIAFGDAEAPQMPLLKDGLSHVNVGQNPFQIGYRTVRALQDLSDGKTVPPTIDTGFVVCKPEQADTCGKQ